MPHNPNKHHRLIDRIRRRRSIRLKGIDYTQPGFYFITIVTKNRECLFGEIADGEMRLNEFGMIARAEWLKTAEIRHEIALDEFVIMPNHIHGIIHILPRDCDDGVGARRRRAPTVNINAPTANWNAPTENRRAHTLTEQFGKPVSGSIPTIIRAYKSATTNRINKFRENAGAPVWQRNYYEHIVREDDDLARIREYVRYNPAGWVKDDENPAFQQNGNS
jgi:putative transposase